MIYNTSNWSNGTTERQKQKKTCFDEWKVKLDCPMHSKQINLKGVYSWNKMWPLKSLAMLKCGSRTNIHVVQYK